MATLRIRSFRSSDLDAAAELLAASHARILTAAPPGLAIGEPFTVPSACRGLIDQAVSSSRASAVVAESGGRVCAYLVGERQVFSAEDFASIYAEPRSVMVPLQGQAVAENVDARDAIEAMYTALAAKWVGAGFFVHNVSVSALDRGLLEAWAWLGFGRKSMCAVRPTARVGRDVLPLQDVAIEEIHGRDDDALDEFHRRLMVFQTGSPMFWPYSGEADAKVRSVRREAMVGGKGTAFLARQGENVLGSLLFVPAMFLSPLLVCERMVYLWEGFVEGDRRSAGVGSMLLSHAMTALKRRGIDWCALHFVAGNPRGGRFWPARGFFTVETTLKRSIDERIAWAKGRSV